MKRFENICTHFDAIHEHGRQTDVHTGTVGQRRPRYVIASCGKNAMISLYITIIVVVDVVIIVIIIMFLRVYDSYHRLIICLLCNKQQNESHYNEYANCVFSCAI